MSFADDYRDFKEWERTVQINPEAWVEYKKREAVYDDHQANLLKYEIGLDLVELVIHLLRQGPVEDGLLGEAVRRSYDWDRLLGLDEPE